VQALRQHNACCGEGIKSELAAAMAGGWKIRHGIAYAGWFVGFLWRQPAP
jgi:hypothetical protein